MSASCAPLLAHYDSRHALSSSPPHTVFLLPLDGPAIVPRQRAFERMSVREDVSVLTRQTYQGGTRGSRLCGGGSPNLEPEG
jgi:hypothetical protein